MLSSHYTEELLGIKDVIVTNIEEMDYEKHIYLDCKLQTQICPRCHAETKRIHSYRWQVVKDLPIAGKNTYLHVRKRRYFCPHCNHTFLEKLSFLKRYQRTTQRLLIHVINDFRDPVSTKYIAQKNNIGIGVAFRMFDHVAHSRPKLPPIISIDEFKGNAGRKYQCILTDPIKKEVLDILPNKLSTQLKLYFLGFPLKERAAVKYVVMDMSLQFAEIATFCFPNAKIVIDKFHVCRHITWSLDDVRKRVQGKLTPDKRKWFKRSRFIMLKHSNELTEEELRKLTIMTSYSDELRWAYYIKELFYTFMDSKNVDEAKKNYYSFRLAAMASNLTRFKQCCILIDKRKESILRAFETGYTNGFTEGCNNKVKVLKRNCYGVRNFSRFRNRILYMMAS